MKGNVPNSDRSTDEQEIVEIEKAGRFIIATSEDVDEIQKTGEWIATQTPAPLEVWN